MSDPHKLTRQERKEALAGYDRNIEACEALYDVDGSDNWRRQANAFQRSRALRLEELEAPK